jgi:Pectate lyase superfamily protein
MPSLFLNVTDFGAKGDGIADDTSPIQQAVDLASVQGNVIVLPAGRYRTTKPIEIRGHGVTLQGAGTHATFLLPDGSFNALEGAETPHPLFNTVFADFQIWFKNTTCDVAGIDMSNFSASACRQVQVAFANGCGCTGFVFRSDTVGNSPYYNMMVQCAVAGGKEGTRSAGFRFAPRVVFTADNPPMKQLFGNVNANQIVGGHVTTCDYGVWFEVGYSNIADGLVTESIYEAHYAFGGDEPSLDSRGNRVLAGYAEGLGSSHLTKFVGGGGVIDNVVYPATYSGLQGGSLTLPGLIDPQSTIRNNVIVRGSTTSGDLTLYANRHYALALTQLAKSDRGVTFDDLSGIVALRAAAHDDSQAQTLAQLQADFNGLLAKLRATGVIASA